MAINLFFEEIDPIKVSWKRLRRNIKALIAEENYIDGSIAVILCNDSYLLAVNNEYLNHDFYTDIITFNYSVGKVISGDLFISLERILENSTKFGVVFQHELERVIYHGILHMTGYNDKSSLEKKVMRERENYYLEKFSNRNVT